MSDLLRQAKFPKLPKDESEAQIKDLQLCMVRVQQGLWHQKKRAIIAFEGFDAAGKGGAIQRITENLDPRGFKVHPIGPPSRDEQGKHWLYRFWKGLPSPGTLAIFDRTWYGRVLVERVEGMAEKSAWKRAYGEINEFERMLTDDGVDIIKVFFAISKDEQLKRFEERLTDPYKQWKLTSADIEARKHWGKYVEAVDEMIEKTSLSNSKWQIIPADHKSYARVEALKIVTKVLERHSTWMEIRVGQSEQKSLKQALKELGVKTKGI